MSLGTATVRTLEARAAFLAKLAEACNVTPACRAAGIGQATAYELRDDDKAFASEWLSAVEEVADKRAADIGPIASSWGRSDRLACRAGKPRLRGAQSRGQGRVHHVGTFADLEEQMTMSTTAGYAGGGLPDRLDALVWALTELSVGRARYDIEALIQRLTAIEL